jgi:hypothetical protein
LAKTHGPAHLAWQAAQKTVDEGNFPAAINPLLQTELHTLMPTTVKEPLKPMALTDTTWKQKGQAFWQEFKEESAEAREFVTMGLLSVAPPEKKHNIVKESLFQSIANIGFCGLGAMLGTAAIALMPAAWQNNRAIRLSTMAAGLSAGIVTGAKLATGWGQKLEDQLDKLSGGEAGELQPESDESTRKIEPLDMAIHVDDVPLAAQVAMRAFGEVIPWFYIPSFYRAGIGYTGPKQATNLFVGE